MKETLELLAAMASKKGEVPDQKELYLDIGERAVKATTAAFACKADAPMVRAASAAASGSAPERR